MAQLFYAYATQDARFRDQFEAALRRLKQRGILDEWHARAVGPGAGLPSAQGSAQLEQADIIVFLLSRDLVSGEYGYSADLRVALERHRKGEARIIAVMLRPCALRGTPFAGLPTLSPGGKPISEAKSSDAAFESVAAAIAGALARRDGAAASTAAPHAPVNPSVESATHAGGAAQPVPAAAASATPADAAATAAAGTPGSSVAPAPTPAQVALQPNELGPEYVPVESPGGAKDGAAGGAKYVSLASLGTPRGRTRRVAQLVNLEANAQTAMARLEAAVRAEVAKGGKIDPAPAETEPGIACKRVRLTQPAPTVSIFATKGPFLVAAKVIDGEPAAATEDAVTLADTVVRRMLARIPSQVTSL